MKRFGEALLADLQREDQTADFPPQGLPNLLKRPEHRQENKTISENMTTMRSIIP